MKMIVKPFRCALLLFLSNASAAQTSFVDYDAMYLRCMNDEDTTSNGSVEACSDEIAYAVKKEITSLHKNIYEILCADFPDDARQFEQGQRAWTTYRDEHCRLAGAHVGNPMYSYCPMSLSIARVKELRELAGQLQLVSRSP